MPEEERELTEDELDEVEGEPLPEREAMPIITPTPGDELWSTPVEPPGT